LSPATGVAYLGVNTPSFLEVIYGAAKLEAIATSLNNRLARGEIETILGDAEPPVLVLGPTSRSRYYQDR
jgi:acyl-CoA synthetase (AMP-forming)/AMP-acid ligase II